MFAVPPGSRRRACAPVVVALAPNRTFMTTSADRRAPEGACSTAICPATAGLVGHGIHGDINNGFIHPCAVTPATGREALLRPPKHLLEHARTLQFLIVPGPYRPCSTHRHIAKRQKGLAARADHLARCMARNVHEAQDTPGRPPGRLPPRDACPRVGHIPGRALQQSRSPLARAGLQRRHLGRTAEQGSAGPESRKVRSSSASTRGVSGPSKLSKTL